MKKLITRIFTAIMLTSLLGLTACKKLTSFDYPASTGTAYEIIGNDNSFSTFRYCVDKAGLADIFSSSDAYTIFAPTNAAITASGYTLAQFQTMLAADVATFVKNHIVSGKVSVKTSATLKALSGIDITIQAQGNAYYADGADIITPDAPTTGGYLNTINLALFVQPTMLDAVKNYQTGTSALQYTMLQAAITRASTGSVNFTALLTGTDKYTFFAPNNGAFIDKGYATVAAVNAAPVEDLVTLLKYQLVTGAKFTASFDSVPVNAYNGTPIYFDKIINSAKTSIFYANGIIFGNTGGANLAAQNGVVHTVNRFFPVPTTTTSLARIQGDANLTLFSAMLTRASTADPKYNFVNMLSDPKASYTIFAITNAGMTAASYPDAATINAAPAADLAKIVKFHMLNKRNNNINQADNSSANTLLLTTNTSGSVVYNPLYFTLTGGFKVRGGSNPTAFAVSPANIITTNGIVNVVPSMLTP